MKGLRMQRPSRFGLALGAVLAVLSFPAAAQEVVLKGVARTEKPSKQVGVEPQRLIGVRQASEVPFESPPTRQIPCCGELAANLKRRGMTMERNPGMELTYSYFQMQDPVVGGYGPEKIALRRAIVLGQDVGAEISIGRKSQAIVSYSPIGPGALGYDPAFRSTAT